MRYFHRFWVQDHLYEYYCAFELLFGERPIEIESAVGKQTKNLWFCFFQNILPATIFYHRQMDI